jgi:hypothetical protein
VARADPLRQRALRVELDLELVGQELLLERRVLAHVAADHLADLSRLQQQAQPEVVHARVVRDAGEVLDAAVAQGDDEVLGNAAQAEPSHHDGHAVAEDALVAQVGQAGGRVGEDLAAHRMKLRFIGLTSNSLGPVGGRLLGRRHERSLA